MSSSSPAAISIYHLPMIGYFVMILLVGRYTLSAAISRKTLASTPAIAFLLLAFAALFFTWKYMFLFFERSFIEAALKANVRPQVYSTEAWLRSVSLFSDAWTFVCASMPRWWFSSQLCAFTAGPFMVAMSLGPPKLRRKAWAFMLLGQIVAISFAAGLWGVAVCTTSVASLGSILKEVQASMNESAKAKGKGKAKAKEVPTQKVEPESPSVSLTLCSILSLISTTFIPQSVDTPNFLPILLLTHALLMVPLLPLPAFPVALPVPSYSRLSFLHLVLSTYLHYPYIQLYRPTLEQLYNTLYSHPAQSSIGFDVVFVHAIAALAIIGDAITRKTMGGVVVAIGCLVSIPNIGLAGCCSGWLMFRQFQGIGGDDDDSEVSKEKEVKAGKAE